MFDRITEPGTMGGRRHPRPAIRRAAPCPTAAGRTLEEIREDFPFIQPDDVQQALL